MGRPDGSNLLPVDSNRPVTWENSHDGRMGDQPSVPLVDFQTPFRGGTAQLRSVATLEVLFLFFILERPGSDGVGHYLVQVPQRGIKFALRLLDCGNVPAFGGLL